LCSSLVLHSIMLFTDVCQYHMFKTKTQMCTKCPHLWVIPSNGYPNQNKGNAKVSESHRTEMAGIFTNKIYCKYHKITPRPLFSKWLLTSQVIIRRSSHI
ncbi:unnamed protein product, partial [Owenia fusiformis]